MKIGVISMKKNRKTHHSTDTQTIDGGITLGVIIGTCVFLWSGSFMLSLIPVVAIPLLLALNNVIPEPTAYIRLNEEQLQKRRERIQQQVKVKIINQAPPTKDLQQSQTADKSRELIPLLEVDKFQ